MLRHGQGNLAHTLDVWKKTSIVPLALSNTCQSVFMHAYDNHIETMPAKAMSWSACSFMDSRALEW